MIYSFNDGVEQQQQCAFSYCSQAKKGTGIVTDGYIYSLSKQTNRCSSLLMMIISRHQVSALAADKIGGAFADEICAAFAHQIGCSFSC